MAALRDEVKYFITQSLACFDTPSQVAEAVKEEYGLEVTRPQVQSYDPYKSIGKDLGKKYVVIFNETRKAFLDDITKIPIASQSFRLRSLQRSYEFFTQRKNYIAANQVLEQAAKEVGGYYTNKVKLADAGDGVFNEFLSKIANSSLPIIHDIEGEHEVLEAEPIKQVEKKSKWKVK